MVIIHSFVYVQKWTELVPTSKLGAGYIDTCDTFLPVDNREAWTHLRLNYYPDGGVARFRVFGQVKRSWEDISINGIFMKEGNVIRNNRNRKQE